jgi:hypothetical protein
MLALGRRVGKTPPITSLLEPGNSKGQSIPLNLRREKNRAGLLYYHRLNFRSMEVFVTDNPTEGNHIRKIGGASIQKGEVRPLTEGEIRGMKPSKPVGLSRPKPVSVPAPPSPTKSEKK